MYDRTYAKGSHTIFSNFSLFGATIFQIYEVKSATMYRVSTVFRPSKKYKQYMNNSWMSSI